MNKAAMLEKHQERFAKYLERFQAIPDLPFITATVMASDYAGMQSVEELYRSGEVDFHTAQGLVGSYARLEWVHLHLSVGEVEESVVFEMLPELWAFSDPDDTRPEFLSLWKRAKEWNGGILYGKTTKPLMVDKIRLYRGQMPGEFGFAWSLDMDVAQRFARGAGVRCPQPGTLYTGEANTKDVLGHMTERGEAEIIIDPEHVYNRVSIGTYLRKE